MPAGLSRSEYRAFNLRVAHRDIPRAMIWIGSVITAFGLIDMVVPPHSSLVDFTGVMVTSLGFVLAGILLRRSTRHSWIGPWVFSAAATAVVGWLLFVFVREPNTSNLTYVIISVTAFGPMSFSWRPFLAGVAAMGCALAYSVTAVGLAGINDWYVGTAGAIITSAVLLEVRLRLLRELADSEHANALLSGNDTLTGVLNRRGLEDRLPQVWADALRRDEPVTVCFFDVRGLKRANDNHGHDFGDLVIRDVADAIRATVRGGDLVARWGGDEFVSIGIGEGIQADSLSDRLNASFDAHGQAQRDGWSGEVTVGVAVASAADHDFTSLLQTADNAMYARRLPR
jgi:diguanylate cyclase (GGDEF)-like protein